MKSAESALLEFDQLLADLDEKPARVLSTTRSVGPTAVDRSPHVPKNSSFVRSASTRTPPLGAAPTTAHSSSSTYFGVPRPLSPAAPASTGAGSASVGRVGSPSGPSSSSSDRLSSSSDRLFASSSDQLFASTSPKTSAYGASATSSAGVSRSPPLTAAAFPQTPTTFGASSTTSPSSSPVNAFARPSRAPLSAAPPAAAASSLSPAFPRSAPAVASTLPSRPSAPSLLVSSPAASRSSPLLPRPQPAPAAPAAAPSPALTRAPAASASVVAAAATTSSEPPPPPAALTPQQEGLRQQLDDDEARLMRELHRIQLERSLAFGRVPESTSLESLSPSPTPGHTVSPASIRHALVSETSPKKIKKEKREKKEKKAKKEKKHRSHRSDRHGREHATDASTKPRSPNEPNKRRRTLTQDELADILRSSDSDATPSPAASPRDPDADPAETRERQRDELLALKMAERQARQAAAAATAAPEPSKPPERKQNEAKEGAASLATSDQKPASAPVKSASVELKSAGSSATAVPAALKPPQGSLASSASTPTLASSAPERKMESSKSASSGQSSKDLSKRRGKTEISLASSAPTALKKSASGTPSLAALLTEEQKAEYKRKMIEQYEQQQEENRRLLEQRASSRSVSPVPPAAAAAAATSAPSEGASTPRSAKRKSAMISTSVDLAPASPSFATPPAEGLAGSGAPVSTKRLLVRKNGAAAGATPGSSPAAGRGVGGASSLASSIVSPRVQRGGGVGVDDGSGEPDLRSLERNRLLRLRDAFRDREEDKASEAARRAEERQAFLKREASDERRENIETEKFKQRERERIQSRGGNDDMSRIAQQNQEARKKMEQLALEKIHRLSLNLSALKQEIGLEEPEREDEDSWLSSDEEDDDAIEALMRTTRQAVVRTGTPAAPRSAASTAASAKKATAAATSATPAQQQPKYVRQRRPAAEPEDDEEEEVPMSEEERRRLDELHQERQLRLDAERQRIAIEDARRLGEKKEFEAKLKEQRATMQKLAELEASRAQREREQDAGAQSELNRKFDERRRRLEAQQEAGQPGSPSSVGEHQNGVPPLKRDRSAEKVEKMVRQAESIEALRAPPAAAPSAPPNTAATAAATPSAAAARSAGQGLAARQDVQWDDDHENGGSRSDKDDDDEISWTDSDDDAPPRKPLQRRPAAEAAAKSLAPAAASASKLAAAGADPGVSPAMRNALAARDQEKKKALELLEKQRREKENELWEQQRQEMLLERRARRQQEKGSTAANDDDADEDSMDFDSIDVGDEDDDDADAANRRGLRPVPARAPGAVPKPPPSPAMQEAIAAREREKKKALDQLDSQRQIKELEAWHNHRQELLRAKAEREALAAAAAQREEERLKLLDSLSTPSTVPSAAAEAAAAPRPVRSSSPVADAAEDAAAATDTADQQQRARAAASQPAPTLSSSPPPVATGARSMERQDTFSAASLLQAVNQLDDSASLSASAGDGASASDVQERLRMIASLETLLPRDKRVSVARIEGRLLQAQFQAMSLQDAARPPPIAFPNQEEQFQSSHAFVRAIFDQRKAPVTGWDGTVDDISPHAAVVAAAASNCAKLLVDAPIDPDRVRQFAENLQRLLEVVDALVPKVEMMQSRSLVVATAHRLLAEAEAYLGALANPQTRFQVQCRPVKQLVVDLVRVVRTAATYQRPPAGVAPGGGANAAQQPPRILSTAAGPMAPDTANRRRQVAVALKKLLDMVTVEAVHDFHFMMENVDDSVLFKEVSSSTKETIQYVSEQQAFDETAFIKAVSVLTRRVRQVARQAEDSLNSAILTQLPVFLEAVIKYLGVLVVSNDDKSPKLVASRKDVFNTLGDLVSHVRTYFRSKPASTSTTAHASSDPSSRQAPSGAPLSPFLPPHLQHQHSYGSTPQLAAARQPSASSFSSSSSAYMSPLPPPPPPPLLSPYVPPTLVSSASMPASPYGIGSPLIPSAGTAFSRVGSEPSSSFGGTGGGGGSGSGHSLRFLSPASSDSSFREELFIPPPPHPPSFMDATSPAMSRESSALPFGSPPGRFALHQAQQQQPPRGPPSREVSFGAYPAAAGGTVSGAYQPPPFGGAGLHPSSSSSSIMVPSRSAESLSPRMLHAAANGGPHPHQQPPQPETPAATGVVDLFLQKMRALARERSLIAETTVASQQLGENAQAIIRMCLAPELDAGEFCASCFVVTRIGFELARSLAHGQTLEGHGQARELADLVQSFLTALQLFLSKPANTAEAESEKKLFLRNFSQLLKLMKSSFGLL